MQLSELIAASGVAVRQQNGTGDENIERVVCDSRAAAPETLFVCIRGFTGDGHAFAARAYAAGCRAFLAEAKLSLPDDAVIVYTNDTRRALAQVSAAFYGFPARDLTVIGITGTKGKTTTALMLAAILSENGMPAGYIGSNGVDFMGNHFDTKNTTPESLELHYYFDRMRSAGCRAVVLEVSSQALYLDRVYGIPFDAVAFTNLAPDHIGGFEHPTFEHYRDSKKKLFTDFGATFAVGNADDPATAYMLDGCSALCSSFGVAAGDFRASEMTPFRAAGELGVEFTLIYFGTRRRVRLPMPGAFSVHNALCAVALAHLFGVSIDDAAATLAHTYVRGRFEIVKTPLDAVFILDYAHNGLSLESALTTLRAYAPHRLVCVLGSVGGRTEGRRAELGKVVSEQADMVILTADNPDFEDPAAICAAIRDAFVREIPTEIIPDRAEAVRYAVEHAGAGDIVLFAGKGHEQYQLVRGGKLPFSERRLIEDAAASLALAKVE